MHYHKKKIIVKRTCILIFSKIGLVDQSNQYTEIYLQKNRRLHKLQLPIVILGENNYFRNASSDNVHNYVFQVSPKLGWYISQIYWQKMQVA